MRNTSRSEKEILQKSSPLKPFPIMTVGHSTRTIGEFIDLLHAHGVECLVDVRTIPRSRHNPQFNQEVLPQSLKVAGVDYVHLADLGGLRRSRQDSINLGWRNASFRGFADYMQTEAFERGLAELMRLAEKSLVAVMCAEAVPWRCHRSLIADALVVRGYEVIEISSSTRSQTHELTRWARVDGMRVTYPLEEDLFAGGSSGLHVRSSP